MTQMEFQQALMGQYDQLYRVARGMAANVQDAEDLLQDTYCKALNGQASYQPHTNLGGWLYTIMRNTFLTQQRHHHRRPRPFTELEKESPGHPTWLEPSLSAAHVERGLLREAIEQALDEIRPEHRLPLLRYLAGYRYREIAQEMDLSLANVKVRIHLARQVLRERLGDWYQ